MRSLRQPVLWFFVLTCVLAGIGQCVHFLVSRRLAAGVPAGTPIEDTPLMTWIRCAPFVTGSGPSVAGVVLTFFLYGVAGVRRLASRLNPWPLRRAGPVLAACLLLPVGVIVLPLGILAAFGGSVLPPSWSVSTYVGGAFFGGGLVGPGLLEEIGWRGFALPHLQRRHSALVSSLLIGLVWALWHLPNFILPSEPLPWWHPLTFVPLILALSVLFTWVYNSTGGNLFAVVVLHGAIDTALDLRLSSDSGMMAREDGIALLLFAVIAVGLVWRYGAANLSRRARVLAEPA